MVINSIAENSCETLINQQIGAKFHESLMGKSYVFCTLGYTWDSYIMCFHCTHTLYNKLSQAAFLYISCTCSSLSPDLEKGGEDSPSSHTCS